MPEYSADGQSVSLKFEDLFPDSKDTGTITGHGDTVTVGDLVEVTFHDPRGASPEDFHTGRDAPRITQVVISGISPRPDGNHSVYVKDPAHPEFVPSSFSVGHVRVGGWWRMFKKVGRP